MSIGIWQLILILLIVFVIFGAGKLPRVMGDLGRGIKSLKKGLNEEEEQKEKLENSEKDSQKMKNDDK